MDAFSRVAARTALSAVGVVFAIAAGAGVVRLLPWLSSPDVPLLVALPFARALTAVAVETAALVGLPLGFGLAAAILVDRGEARALCALGAAPFRLGLNALPTLLAFAVCLSTASSLIDPGVGVPGRLARDLVEQGRSSCDGAVNSRAALVPMTPFTWLCFPGRAPVLVGPVPRSRGRVWLSAHNAVPSDDLRRMDLEGLELFVLPEAQRPTVRARVVKAQLRGLTPWGRPAQISAFSRAVLVVCCVVVLSLSLATVLFERAVRSRILAAVVGLVAAVLVLSLLHRVEGIARGPALYWLVPWAGLAPWIGGRFVTWASSLRRRLVNRRLRPLGR